MLWLYVLNLGLPFDEPLQRLFFASPCNAAKVRDCWLLSKEDAALNFWLHSVPRWCAWSVAAVAALVAIKTPQHRIACATLILGIGFTALFCALLKQFTGHYCPGQLMRYGGVVADVVLDHPAPRCFPAGHPSPGFGLIALYFAPLSKRWRYTGLLAGLLAGGFLSMIQIARGEHFLSHILATLLVALWVGYVIGSVFKMRGGR